MTESADEFDVVAFVEDLTRFASAKEVIDGVEEIVGARPPSKQNALDRLSRALGAAANDAIVDIVGTIVKECYAHPTLHDWTREVIGEQLNKEDAFEALFEHYGGSGDAEDESSGSDHEEDDSASDGLFDVDEFLEDLASFASAAEVRDGAGELLGRTPATKDTALDELEDHLAQVSDEDRHDALATALSQCYADPTIHRWTRELFGVQMNKDEGVEALIDYYLGNDLEELEATDDDDEDGDEVSSRTHGRGLEGEDDTSFDFDSEKAAQPPHDYQQELVSELARRTDSARPGEKLLIHVATGGGKTRIANDWLWKHVIPAGHRVLWVTKDWELLKQAAGDLCRRYEGARQRLGRLGSKFPELEENDRASIVYTTIHTWNSRRQRMLRQHFDYIVVDELHWGEGKPAYQRLTRRHEGAAKFIGLTATPRDYSHYDLVGRRYGFPELVQRGVLARPVIHGGRKLTGIEWRPVRSGSHGDFTQPSLQQLARNARRNNFIIDTYGSGDYGKTLVFACNVEHAERLAALFSRAGVPANYIHYAMDTDDRRRVLDHFRRVPTGVLVNVAMLIYGIDIPDIETVFLARPTASPILFSQMVGRGSRRVPGRKDSFKIVDFVDSLEEHGDALVTSQEFFGVVEETVSIPTPSTSSGRLERHEYRPSDVQVYPDRPGYEVLRGLEIQPEQTFGIEFEFTRGDFSGEMPDDWKSVATSLLEAIRHVVGPERVEESPLEDHGSDAKRHTVWNVEWDSTCGWEITTPVLKGERGLEEVHDVCAALQPVTEALGLRVNYRTGTHVHLGWDADASKLARLMSLVSHYEPALFSLVSPSRWGNEFCQPIRSLIDDLSELVTLNDWRREFRPRAMRFHTVNPKNLFGGLGTVEVRLHNGTQEAAKILAWTSLWMRTLNAVDRGVTAPPKSALGELPLCEGQSGDILALLAAVGAGRPLKEKIEARRDSVLRESWAREGSRHSQLTERVRPTWQRLA